MIGTAEINIKIWHISKKVFTTLLGEGVCDIGCNSILLISMPDSENKKVLWN